MQGVSQNQTSNFATERKQPKGHGNCIKKTRQINKWNRIEDPEINPCSYTHQIFDKEDQNMC
jgi:hypothetical protein